MTEEVPDEELAARAAAGDAAAFGRIYDRYRTMVYTLAVRTLGSEADAEDALQQTFLRVHRGLARFRGDSKLSTWIWQVALSAALTARRGRRASASLDDAHATEPADPRPGPAEAAAAGDDASLLRRHLERLAPRDRAILHMRYQEGKPFEEIAAILGMPVGTAKSLVFRAKAELRRNLEIAGHAM